MQKPKVEAKSYLAFLSLAFTTYLSFYCLMSSVNYWKVIYNSVFTTLVCALYNFLEIAGTLYSMKYGVRFDVTVAVNMGLFTIIAALLVIPIFYFVKNFYARYILTILPILAGGFASGQYYCMLSSCGARISPTLSQSIQLGIGISEFVIQLLKDAVNIFFEVSPSDPRYQIKLFYNTLVYYGFGISILIMQFPVWKYVRNTFGEYTTPLDDRVATTKQLHLAEQQISLLDPETDVIQVAQTAPQPEVLLDAKKESQNLTKKQLMKYLAPSLSAQCIQYLISYTVFPALFTAVPNYHTSQLNNNWFNLLLLTLYFGGDCVGRLLPYFRCTVQLFNRLEYIISLSYSRVVFIPIYFLMVLPRPIFESLKLPLIHNDVFATISALCFGITGGLAGTLLFMKYQDKLSTQEERGHASLIMTIFYQTGITLGGIVSIFLAVVVQD